MAKRERHNEDRQTLLEGLERTRSAIARAYAGFNGAADPELIESYVYEINALQARYGYLLRQVKALESGEVPPRREGAAYRPAWPRLLTPAGSGGDGKEAAGWSGWWNISHW